MSAMSKTTASSEEAERSPDEHEIVDRIYTAVMEQRLPPNTKLSESKLCESFGVGRLRIRRALLLLSNQGIVNLRSNRGAFIAQPDAKEAHDVFTARMDVETSVTRRVAEKAGPNDLEMLERHVGLEDAARRGRDRRELIGLSGRFHVELAASSGNAVITKIVRELVTRTSLIIGLFGTSGRSSCPEHEHRDMVSAIRDRDVNSAEALMCEHLNHIEEDLDLSATGLDQPDLVEILRD